MADIAPYSPGLETPIDFLPSQLVEHKIGCISQCYHTFESAIMRAVSNSHIVVLYVGDGLAVATIRDAIVDVEGDHVLVGVTLSKAQVLTHRSKGLSIPFHPMPHFTAVTARVTHNSFAADIVTVVLGGKRQPITPHESGEALLLFEKG